MVFMYDVQHNSVPSYIHDIFTDYRNPVVDVSTIRDWDSVPARIKDCYSRNSFKYNIRTYLNGKKDYLTSTKLDLNRKDEISLNRTKCDLIFKSRLFSHNFNNINDPSCECGSKS
jgi:hypothetical protein